MSIALAPFQSFWHFTCANQQSSAPGIEGEFPANCFCGLLSGGCGLSASFVVDCYLVVPTERANRTSGTNQNHIDSGLFPFERLFL